MKKKRMDWVDGMKFLAILWIFCGHFSLTYDGTFFNGLRSVAGG